MSPSLSMVPTCVIDGDHINNQISDSCDEAPELFAD